MIAEFSSAVLLEDMPAGGIEHQALQDGDVGTVLDILGCGMAYILEMFNADGTTLDVITVQAHQVRPVNERDVLRVRVLDSQPTE